MKWSTARNNDKDRWFLPHSAEPEGASHASVNNSTALRTSINDLSRLLHNLSCLYKRSKTSLWLPSRDFPRPPPPAVKITDFWESDLGSKLFLCHWPWQSYPFGASMFSSVKFVKQRIYLQWELDYTAGWCCGQEACCKSDLLYSNPVSASDDLNKVGQVI